MCYTMYDKRIKGEIFMENTNNLVFNDGNTPVGVTIEEPIKDEIIEEIKEPVEQKIETSSVPTSSQVNTSNFDIICSNF